MRIRTMLTAVLACIAGAALAQEMGPPAELKKLDWFMGDWSGTIKWTFPGMAGEGVMSFSNVWEGQFMKNSSSMDMNGQKSTEVGFLGWNAKTKQYDSWTFTSFAPTPRVEHGTLTGDKIVFLSEPWDVMGMAMESRAAVSKKGAAEIYFLLEFKMEGAWTKAGEGTFKRVAKTIKATPIVPPPDH